MSDATAAPSLLPITLKVGNYRGIPEHSPLEIELKSNIAFIVGVNNVGKSNLLKLFFEFRPVFRRIVDQLRNGVTAETKHQLHMQGLAGDLLFHQKSSRPGIEVELRAGASRLTIELGAANLQRWGETYHLTWKLSCPDAAERLSLILQLHDVFQNSMYVGPLRTADKGFATNHRDIAVGRQFVTGFDSWLNGAIVDHRKRAAKLTVELREIFGYQKLEISVSSDKTTLLVRNDDGDFRLDDLGDGISQFIIVLGTALMKLPSIILIDEPEIGLHPRMQEAFVRSLASKARFGMIATSHSIGLARSCADVIYSLVREPSGALRLSPFGAHKSPTLSQSLHELGFSQMVELGATHLLLVEGKSDIKAFREILRHYGIEQHFLIWHLNGRDTLNTDPSQIADELNELKRLPFASISVIFDSERTSPNAPINTRFAAFLKLCGELGFTAFPTDYHSTENYVTQAALDVVLDNSYRALSPHQTFSTAVRKWDKAKNWLLFREMNKADFAVTGLGAFIENSIVPAVQKSLQK